MKIHLEDYQSTLDRLKQERWGGNEFVAFPDQSTQLSREELTFFPICMMSRSFATRCLLT